MGRLNVLARIAIVIFLVEGLIMLSLMMGGYYSLLLNPLIDVIALVLLASPVIYFWVINPYISARDEAEKLLDKIREDLESQVERRTGELSKKIIEIKRADEALRDTKAQLDVAIESFSDGFIMFDADDKFVFANDAYLDSHPSIRESQMSGTDFKTVIQGLAGVGYYGNTPQETEEYIQKRLKCHRTGETFEYRIKDGRYFQMKEFKGRDGGTAMVRIDITKRKLAEEALRVSEVKYRTVFDNSPIGIVLTLGDAMILESNPAYQEMTGYTNEELIKLNWKQITHPDDIELNLELLSEVLEGKRDDFQLEKRYIRKDGTEVWINLIVNAVRGASGECQFLVSMVEDISTRRKAEEKLKMAIEDAEYANRAKTEFLASMSHDLRTPLNAIMGFAEMMKAKIFGPLGDPRYQEYAKDIHDSGNFLVTIIDDILDLSKIEAGKYELNEKNLDVLSLIHNSIKMVSTQVKARKLRLVTIIEPDLPMLRGDDKAITQIINNLLANAIKFTPVNGKVTITAEIDGNGSINILVADTGEGMSKNDITRALRPFEQPDSIHSKRHEGTGLGLHLCQKLIELHGGNIKLQSKLGKGTTVTVHFPTERILAL